MEKIFLAALQEVSGIGAGKLRHLTAYFGSGEAVWQAEPEALAKSGCLDKAALANLLEHRRRFDVDAFAEQLYKKQIKLCSIEESEYPENLKSIFNPPAILFCRGNFSAVPKTIAVVGARNASAYGKSSASFLARDLASAGVEIISGAARGIDTAAHLGALSVGGQTAAVLGCGIDIAYPRENKRLLDEIAEKGIVLSEYGPGTQPNAKFFPARNRIISGIAQGVVVIEAAEKSGSLITAEFAVNEGRDVFALPGSIFSDLHRGCHKLIKQGAKLVENAADILDEYTWNQNAVCQKECCLSEEEESIFKVLQYDVPMNIDEIILKARCSVSNTAFVLLQLQLRGLVDEPSPRSYIRAVKEGVL